MEEGSLGSLYKEMAMLTYYTSMTPREVEELSVHKRKIILNTVFKEEENKYKFWQKLFGGK